MASITKHRNGWRAQVARRGVRRSKLLPTKGEARDWAARQEWLILNAERAAADTPLSDVLARYAREVSPGKRGHRWEVYRIERLRQDKLAKLRLGEIEARHIADWRDRRLRQVKPGSVRREMNLLAAVFTVARLEWGLVPRSPMEGVRVPADPPPRDRLPTDDEIERLRHAAGDDLTKATARAFHAFLFSGETAMRAGEIVGLRWERIDLEARVASLPMTKNGRPRDVPLSSAAVDLLRALPPLDPVFGLSSANLAALWVKIRTRAGVDGLRFHDGRHYGVTKLARRVDVLTLAKITGHRDIRQLMIYYNESAAEIAKRMD